MEQTKTSENIKIWAGILTSLIFGIGVLVLLLLKPWEIILPEIYSVSVGAKGNLITVEETVPLELMFTVLDEKKANRAEDELQETVFSWRSSDESIATVDGEGNVTGVGPGTATIYVEGGGLSSQYLITVYRELKGVTLSEKELTANVGDSVTLTYELDPKDAGQIGEIKWNSADTSVAEVSEDGKVTMKQPGTTEICLTVGEFAAKCVVTVKSPLEKIELNKNTLGLYDGQSASLQVFVFPENTTDDTTVTWTSSDEAVAVVDEKGTVTAVDPGV
ncbi:MAG: Ig-like domain-containing protein, partial [Lachnospiraceae bacterium]|nr:Ig-like domain-containing protein [Lachnospiraceae bacterium]